MTFPEFNAADEAEMYLTNEEGAKLLQKYLGARVAASNGDDVAAHALADEVSDALNGMSPIALRRLIGVMLYQYVECFSSFSAARNTLAAHGIPFDDNVCRCPECAPLGRRAPGHPKERPMTAQTVTVVVPDPDNLTPTQAEAINYAQALTGLDVALRVLNDCEQAEAQAETDAAELARRARDAREATQVARRVAHAAVTVYQRTIAESEHR